MTGAFQWFELIFKFLPAIFDMILKFIKGIKGTEAFAAGAAILQTLKDSPVATA